MVEPDTLDQPIHPEGALLPWYLNGTLREDERRQVDQHLSSCAACRAELDELAQLNVQLHEVYAAQSEPSSRLQRAVLGQVALEASTKGAKSVSGPQRLKGLDEWFRSLFAPRWAPVLVVTLLVAQLGLLLWSMTRPTLLDQVTTRGLGAPTVRLRVVFQETASERQIRSLVQGLRGRIVDGPTSDGAYIMEFPAGDQAAAQKKVDVLRSQRESVRTVEPVTQ
ncbi:MAG: zf-HC2 domain-containing protein [Nitrospirae bacterium]|nr:zf-HC2 domain-containing protein [Nitrospirota bacterium]MDE3220689.1 zf-HC2 domain-containing protein [Nitrospirota bacterium]